MTIPFINLIKTVWQNGKPWHRSIVGYYVAYIVAQSFLSLSPYAFGRTIDLLQHFSHDKLHQILFWLIFGVMLHPLFWLFHGPARVVERNVALKIQQTFLHTLYQKLTQLPLKWHQNHHSGDIITRINRACTALKKFAEDQFIYIQTLVRFLISIGFLFWISIPIGCLSLLTCVLATIAVVFYDRKLVVLYERENEAENHIGAGLFDYISNMTTVLTLRLGKLTSFNLVKRLAAIWPFYKPEVILNEVKWFVMNIIITVVQAIILLGYILIQIENMNTILIGTVVMIFRYQWDLSDVFYTLSQHYSELVQMNTNVRSAEPLLEDIKKYAHAIPGERVAERWKILTLSNLSYAHPDAHESSAIQDITLTIARGEKIALIGASGAGKSTLLNLLSGLYTPDTATLSIDSARFQSLEPLHAITTLIPQEPEIFENTILFNITMGLEATPEDIKKVTTLSGFAPVLETLKQGLATDIREKGLNLSVGQKQRLALARGLFAARFSSFILMDEPTSSVDLPTEKAILSSVIDEYPHATLMVSLHRLHLLPKFSRIIMLKHGKIVADGSTEQLLSIDGPVKKLWEKYQGRE
ncbi:multidrug ABC transporter ATPase/permease (plasmid) [Legionella adelaidensis]|uniref:Multidrug ABC transporter ATPase/permease n=1 Tax=Legionella adelaidensis TaxID=45056 RepID=A0A0W0R6H2_9GAMM|nr:ABC transporter ATP-binding protein [Legionella adelaidensis]KTC66659.1 multidrug ABC transporter ATPase/permease [Legionella adelaidensis]VEH85834.1 multidrug ABC transporter ATPase/permease [Legionella adelaidensis]